MVSFRTTPSCAPLTAVLLCSKSNCPCPDTMLSPPATPPKFPLLKVKVAVRPPAAATTLKMPPLEIPEMDVTAKPSLFVVVFAG